MALRSSLLLIAATASCLVACDPCQPDESLSGSVRLGSLEYLLEGDAPPRSRVWTSPALEHVTGVKVEVGLGSGEGCVLTLRSEDPENRFGGRMPIEELELDRAGSSGCADLLADDLYLPRGGHALGRLELDGRPDGDCYRGSITVEIYETELEGTGRGGERLTLGPSEFVVDGPISTAPF